MKRNLGWLVLVILVIAAGGWGLTASAKVRPGDFSAQMYIRTASGEEETYDLFASQGKFRLENASKGEKIAAIIRPDLKVAWSLNTAKKMYFEGGLDQIEMTGSVLEEFPGQISKEKLGAETINGLRCTKYRIAYKEPVSSQVRRVTAWFAEELGFYTRTEGEDGFVSELRNVRPGPQPAELFEIPAGYQKLALPGVGPAQGGTPAPAPQARPEKAGPPAASPPAQSQEDLGSLLFANSDFEAGSLQNWTASGEAFSHQPTLDDNPSARGREPSDHEGLYWIGTYERFQGRPSDEPGAVQEDAPTGVLKSIPFVIRGDQISFLVGGGANAESEYVALEVGGREVLKASGADSETMTRVTWEVKPWLGQPARIVIKDLSSEPWGHINADDFVYEGQVGGESSTGPGQAESSQPAAQPPQPKTSSGGSSGSDFDPAKVQRLFDAAADWPALDQAAGAMDMARLEELAGKYGFEKAEDLAAYWVVLIPISAQLASVPDGQARQHVQQIYAGSLGQKVMAVLARPENLALVQKHMSNR